MPICAQFFWLSTLYKDNTWIVLRPERGEGTEAAAERRQPIAGVQVSFDHVAHHDDGVSCAEDFNRPCTVADGLGVPACFADA